MKTPTSRLDYGKNFVQITIFLVIVLYCCLKTTFKAANLCPSQAKEAICQSHSNSRLKT